MVFPFGVSVSDFVAGVKIFKSAIDALSETHGARADFTELSRALSSLDRAVQALSMVEFKTTAQQQVFTQNLDACKLCMATFLRDIAKFRGLNDKLTKTKFTQTFRKIQWALCKKEDVREFRARIEFHVGSLEMLLLIFQIGSVKDVDDRTQKIEIMMVELARSVNQIASEQAETSESIAEKSRSQAEQLSAVHRDIMSHNSAFDSRKDIFLDIQEKLASGLSEEEQRELVRLVRTTLQQNQALLQGMQVLTERNEALVHHVEEIKNTLQAQRSIPSQVLLQQPVILHDALGRIAPFHLEFIDSVGAFLAVLKLRFEHVGRPKISRLEFELNDKALQKPIALRKSWQGVFRPGQNVDMSMLFQRELAKNQCPGCQAADLRSFKDGEVIQWHVV